MSPHQPLDVENHQWLGRVTLVGSGMFLPLKWSQPRTAPFSIRCLQTRSWAPKAAGNPRTYLGNYKPSTCGAETAWSGKAKASSAFLTGKQEKGAGPQASRPTSTDFRWPVPPAAPQRQEPREETAWREKVGTGSRPRGEPLRPPSSGFPIAPPAPGAQVTLGSRTSATPTASRSLFLGRPPWEVEAGRSAFAFSWGPKWGKANPPAAPDPWGWSSPRRGHLTNWGPPSTNVVGPGYFEQ